MHICLYHWAANDKSFSASGSFAPLSPDQGAFPWIPLGATFPTPVGLVLPARRAPNISLFSAAVDSVLCAFATNTIIKLNVLSYTD